MAFNKAGAHVFITFLLGLSHPALSVEQSHDSIGVTYSYETLNNGQTPWQHQSFQWQSEQKKVISYLFGVDRYSRFGQNDVNFSAEYIRFIDPDWYIDTTLSYTPDAKVIKKYSVEMWSHKTFAPGWVFGLGSNVSAYPTSTADAKTWAILSEVEKYIGQYRFSYRVISTDVSLPSAPSQWMFSHMFTAAYYYAENSNVSMTLASGRELENDGTPTPPVSQISALTFKHEHYFSSSWHSELAINWHQQGNLYNRFGVSIGAAYEY